MVAGRRCIFSIVGRQMEWTDAVRRPPSHVAYGNCLFFMVWAADTAATMVRPRLIVISLSLECFFCRDYYKTNLFFYSLQARPPRSAACRVCFFMLSSRITSGLFSPPFFSGRCLEAPLHGATG